MFQYRFSINFHNLNGLHSLCIFLFLLFAPISAFAATSIPFTVNLSKAVNVTGTPRIAIDVGGVARYATYTSGSGTSALTFTHTMVAGDVDLDGITLTASIDLNGGTIKDLAGNDLSPLTFTVPNTTNVKVNYPSLGMDFVADADGRYTLNGTAYNDLTSFLSAAGGSFTRASTATYFDSTGTLQTAASGVPRFDHDPVTLQPKGILIEESRTNMIPNSIFVGSTGTNIHPTGWAPTGGTIVASNTPSSGTLNQAYVAMRKTNTGYQGFQVGSMAYTLNTAYTISADIRIPTGLTAADCSVYFGTATPLQLNFATAAQLNAQPKDQWVRYSVTVTFTANSSNQLSFASVSGSPSGTGWDIRLPQLELGSFATSYIPTTTATVTRDADTLTIPTGSWFNATAMTLAAEYSSYATNGYSTRIISVNDAAINAYQLADAMAGIILSQKLISGTPNNSSGPTYVPGTTYKVAAAMDATSSPLAVNNTLYSNSIAGTPAGLNRLQVGNQNSLNYLNGQIKKAKYYPARVSNTQLQLMTQ